MTTPFVIEARRHSIDVITEASEQLSKVESLLRSAGYLNQGGVLTALVEAIHRMNISVEMLKSD